MFFPPPAPQQTSPSFPPRGHPVWQRSQRFERSRRCELDSRSRRCLDRNILPPRPPPAPPIYREELFPLQRLCYDSAEPNPNLRDDRFNRGLLNCSVDLGSNDRFIDVRNGVGYRDGDYLGREFYEDLDDRFGDRLSHRGCCSYHERHSHECRLNTDVKDRDCELYARRDNRELRSGGGIVSARFTSYTEGNDFERRLINDINNRRLGLGVSHRAQELYTNRDDVGGRLDYGINNRVWEHGNGRLCYGMDEPVCDLDMTGADRNRMSDSSSSNGYANKFDKLNYGSMRGGDYSCLRGHDDLRGLDGAACGHDGYARRLVFEERYDKRLKNSVGEGVSLELANARQTVFESDPPFRWGLWNQYRNREAIRFNKKDVRRKTALHRVQLGRPFRRSRAHVDKHVPRKLTGNSRGKGILTSSDPVVKSDINSATEKKNIISDENNGRPASPLTQSEEGVGINDVSTFASNSESSTTVYGNLVLEDSRDCGLSEDMNSEGSGNDTSRKIWRISLLEEREEAQHVNEISLKNERDGIESINVEICTNDESRDPQLNAGAELLNCDTSSAFNGGTTDNDSVLLLAESAEVPIFYKGRESVGLSIPQEIAEASDIRGNKSYLDIQMDRSIRTSNVEVHQKSDIGVMSDVGSEHFAAKTAQVSKPMVKVNTEESESLSSTAMMACYSITFGATSSDVLPHDHKGVLDSFQEAVSDRVPPLPFQCSAGVKRKAEATQVYDSDIDAVTDSIGTADGAVITDLRKDTSGALEIDFPVENGISKEKSSMNEESRGVKGSDVDFDTDYPSSGHKKKRKVLISESTPSLPTEHDLVAEGNSPDNMSECDTIESERTYGCDTTYVEGKVSEENVAQVDTMADRSKHHKRDGCAFIGNNGALEIDFPVENGISKENSSVNEESRGVKDSDVDFDIDYPSSGHKKKRKVLISESTPSLPTEDDLVAEGNSPDNVSECDTIESERTNGCDTTYVEGKLSEENVAQVDTMADGSQHHERDDCAFIGNTLSLSGDANDVSTSSPVDELDTDHCPSSPEDLLSHTDFSFSPNWTTLAFQPKGQVTFLRDKVIEGNTFITHAKRSPTLLYPRNTTRVSILEGQTKPSPKLKAAGGNFNLKKNQPIPSVPNVFPSHPLPYSSSRKFQPSLVTKSRTWHRSDNSSAAVTGVKQQRSIIPQSQKTNVLGASGNSYIRKGNSLVRNPSPSVLPLSIGDIAPINRPRPSTENVRKNQASDNEIRKYGSLPQVGMEKGNSSDSTKETVQPGCGQPPNRRVSKLGESVRGSIIHSSGSPALDSSQEIAKASIIAGCRTNSSNKVIYIRKKSNQLIAASDTEDSSVQRVNSTQAPSSDGYYKKRKNQLVRAPAHSRKENVSLNVDTARHGPPALSIRSSVKRRSYFKVNRHSKFSLVWKLHDTKSTEKINKFFRPKMGLPHLIPWKRATYRKSFFDALISKPNKRQFSVFSHKILLSRKRGAIYTRSSHGYSLRMSKVLSVGGSSLKWSKSLEKNSKKVKEDAARSVAAAAKIRKEEINAPPVLLKSRNISRERTLSVGCERYKMDSSGRTLLRITEESSCPLHKTAKDVKKSYIPSRRLIGSEEYVRIGNGNQLIRDPKRRTRMIASERVRWSLRTARLRLARKKTYCQFFTRFGKCNKEDGKCPYLHDVSKIAVCTKFLTGTCSNVDCKLTHKVIPERMPDCSYFLKGSCSNENCPYRHVIVDPDSAVCESFLRGYCADGNECRKKHTYVCPAFEEKGICPQISTCKLHHPKKKTEKKPLIEQKKTVRGRYFDGGLTPFGAESSKENLSSKGKDDLTFDDGKYPDYISLGIVDEELLEETSARREDGGDDVIMGDVDHRLGSPLAFDGSY